jgi:hypothetical protein
MKILSKKVNYGDKIYDNANVQEIKSQEDWVSDWMDAECVDLCDAFNSIKGIETVESCCGHNKSPYHIFFKCHDLNGLRFIQSCIDRRYWKYGSDWKITTYISDEGPESLIFVLESKSSKLSRIMPQVKDMIETLNYYLNHRNRFDFLGLDYDNFIFEVVEKNKKKKK